MNERTQHLKDMLRELESELATIDTLDPEARALLADAAQEIQQVLAGKASEAEEPSGAAADRPVHDRLSTAMERFETSHPTLTAVLGRLVDTLAQMGI